MSTYCGICYTIKQKNPYGYCDSCWVKAGKPTKDNPQGSIDKRQAGRKDRVQTWQKSEDSL